MSLQKPSCWTQLLMELNVLFFSSRLFSSAGGENNLRKLSLSNIVKRDFYVDDLIREADKIVFMTFIK